MNLRIGGNYIYFGLLFIALFSVLSLDLNSEGFRCLSILSQQQERRQQQENETSTSTPSQSLRELEWNCFVVTNSYVYSLFGIIIGGILVFVGYRKNAAGQ